jgi:hypothetical protein
MVINMNGEKPYTVKDRHTAAIKRRWTEGSLLFHMAGNKNEIYPG